MNSDQYWVYEIGPCNQDQAESIGERLQPSLPPGIALEFVDTARWFTRLLDGDSVSRCVAAFDQALASGVLSVDDQMAVAGIRSDMLVWLGGELRR